MSVSIFSDTVCELGEGPTYDPATGTLYWFDIKRGRLLEKQFSGGATRVHELGRMASALAVIDPERQLLATEDGLFVREKTSGRLTLHAALEAGNKATRSNDSRVHPCGAFWVGTMGKNAETGAGAIYWFHRGELRKLFGEVSIPNSIAFSPDGGVAYYTDSAKGEIMRIACDPKTGLPQGEPKIFADRGGGTGDHDGSVVDLDGTLWNARWGESRVTAYSPAGHLVRSLDVPAKQASCPAFCGPDASRLAVTSAWASMDEAARKDDPDAGKTFLLDIEVRGRFEPRVLI